MHNTIHYNYNEQQTKITMNNNYNEQWQYKIQMNNNAQWTTMTNANKNKIMATITIQNARIHNDYNNHALNELQEQCTMTTVNNEQWTRITMTMNNDYNESEQWQQCNE